MDIAAKISHAFIADYENTFFARISGFVKCCRGIHKLQLCNVWMPPKTADSGASREKAIKLSWCTLNPTTPKKEVSTR